MENHVNMMTYQTGTVQTYCSYVYRTKKGDVIRYHNVSVV